MLIIGKRGVGYAETLYNLSVNLKLLWKNKVYFQKNARLLFCLKVSMVSYSSSVWYSLAVHSYLKLRQHKSRLGTNLTGSGQGLTIDFSLVTELGV